MGLIEAVAGALALLGEDHNWEAFGNMTVPETTQLMREMLIRWYDEPCGVAEEVPAPYWEDGIEADDELPVETQSWYGYVSEGNFIEDVGVWAISNFLATAVSEGAAILYATNERKVRLSFLKGGPGGVVKVYVDEALAAIVDLEGTDGEVVDVDILTGYIDEAVEILQVLEEV